MLPNFAREFAGYQPGKGGSQRRGGFFLMNTHAEDFGFRSQLGLSSWEQESVRHGERP